MDAKILNFAPGQEAIDRLLRAQQQADITIAGCREKAEEILAAARDQARVIGHKADGRMSEIHQQRAKKIKKRVQALISLQQKEEQNGETGQQYLEHAVRRLAAQLTGGEVP